LIVFFFTEEHSRLYQTSDYASVQDDGIIRYKGRMDSQVKVRGHRIDLNEIEKYLMDIYGVENVKVICHNAGYMDQTISAFTVIKRNTYLKELEIEKSLRQKLPEYMIPHVTIIDEIPLLNSGKVDQQSLLNLLGSRTGAMTALGKQNYILNLV